MIQIQIPEKVNKIIRTLAAAGQEAYAVGGCVRDAEVVISQSFGSLPKRLSRMQPPTAYASYPARISVSIIRLTFSGNISFILICLSPIYQPVRRFAAAYADGGNLLLIGKRHTARRSRKIFL